MGKAVRRDADGSGFGRSAAAHGLKGGAAAAIPGLIRAVVLLVSLTFASFALPARSTAQSPPASPPLARTDVQGGSSDRFRGSPVNDSLARVVEQGRFRVVAFPEDQTLARSLMQAAVASDSFPGMPRPGADVLIVVAPDERRFREWVGPRVPEWGAAVAFPARGRIVVRGSRAGGSMAGD